MTADRCNLRDCQTEFKQSGDSLVPQIVKMKVFDIRSLCQPIPRESESKGCYRKQAPIFGSGMLAHLGENVFQDRCCSGRKRDGSRIAILRLPDGCQLSFKPDVPEA